MLNARSIQALVFVLVLLALPAAANAADSEIVVKNNTNCSITVYLYGPSCGTAPLWAYGSWTFSFMRPGSYTYSVYRNCQLVGQGRFTLGENTRLTLTLQ